VTDPINTVLAYGTAGTGFGGAVLAQAVQSPAVGLCTVALAAIGLGSLWVKSHYEHEAAVLKTADLQAENIRLQARLAAYEEIVRGRSECPSERDEG
jgi:hypothetical protein